MQEKLPEFRREGTWIVDNSRLEGLNTSVKLLAPKACPDDSLHVRKSQAAASCTRQRVPRVYNLKGDLGVAIFVKAPHGTTPLVRLICACCNRCRCCLGDGGLVLVGEFVFDIFPRCLADGRSRFREEAACRYSYPPSDDGMLKMPY